MSRVFFFLLLFLGSVKGEEPWMVFDADSHLKFELPASLKRSPESGEGERLWENDFKSEDGAFHLISYGFNRVGREADKEGVSVYRYLCNMLVPPRIRSYVTYHRFTKHYLFVVRVNKEEDWKEVDKYYIPYADAGGYALKSIYIRYPWSRRSEFDPWLQRIEGSWKPDETWRE